MFLVAAVAGNIALSTCHVSACDCTALCKFQFEFVQAVIVVDELLRINFL